MINIQTILKRIRIAANYAAAVVAYDNADNADTAEAAYNTMAKVQKQIKES